MAFPDVVFPRYLMTINGERRFLSLWDACTILNSNWVRVELHPDVLESDFTVRMIHPDEENEIRKIADALNTST